MCTASCKGIGLSRMSEMIATANAKGIEEIKSFLSRQKETTKCRMRHIRQTGCSNVYLEGRPTGRTFAP